jgi:hypothetical protein
VKLLEDRHQISLSGRIRKHASFVKIGPKAVGIVQMNDDVQDAISGGDCFAGPKRD